VKLGASLLILSAMRSLLLCLSSVAGRRPVRTLLSLATSLCGSVPLNLKPSYA